MFALQEHSGYGESIKKVHFAALFHNGDLFAEAQISLLVIKNYEVDVRQSKKLKVS